MEEYREGAATMLEASARELAEAPEVSRAETTSVDLTNSDTELEPFGAPAPRRGETCQRFCDQARQQLKEMLRCHGGVEQCLAKSFQHEETMLAFITWAQALWPLNAAIFYSTDAILPSTTEKECAQSKMLTLHPTSLGFGSWATVRGPVENVVAFELLDDILAHGFRTATEPVMVTQPSEMMGSTLPKVKGAFSHACCSLGYYKGRSRCNVMLLILEFARSRGYADLQEALP